MYKCCFLYAKDVIFLEVKNSIVNNFQFIYTGGIEIVKGRAS